MAALEGAGKLIGEAFGAVKAKFFTKAVEKTFEAKLAQRGILGFTEHGAEQMTARGFTEESVLKIVKEGAVKEVVHKGQAQIYYVLGQYRIATAVTRQNAGKIISIMGDYKTVGSDGVRGIFTGFKSNK